MERFSPYLPAIGLNLVLLVVAADFAFRTDQLNWFLLNSNFLTSAVGSLAGAIGGAFGAQRIIEHLKRRDEHVEEIRNCNRGIALLAGVSNGACALKKQHLLKMKEKYDQDRRDFMNARRSKIRGRVDISFDFEYLAEIHFPMSVIASVINERVSVSGIGMSAFVTLERCVQDLNRALKLRNDLISEHMKSPEMDAERRAEIVFAIERDGRVDQRFFAAIDMLSSSADNVIFFSSFVSSELQFRAETVRNSMRGERPDVFKVSMPEDLKHLEPDPKNYSQWVNAASAARESLKHAPSP